MLSRLCCMGKSGNLIAIKDRYNNLIKDLEGRSSLVHL
ncbi:hypothetical protein BbiDN127_I0002 (plasmid) [Borreliella bissettiae DN127]|uniref:Uncharacterized protein n=1 Tax=Borrelia bissettiae (strain DSM 17990 / CIP 109136 / DN127) TaxID=521010 RepID=G0AP61_BORBD|nr:hypothetical protein BbiDN127_I0002 [Borreliella bissettiae DN127]